MTGFILTSAVSMAVLLGLYHLLLEREKMHRFNRSYLIASVVFSLALPFITIEVYTEVMTAPIPVMENDSTVAIASQAMAPVAETVNYWPYVVFGSYLLITFALAARFAINLLRFRRKVRNNITVQHEDATLVLLDTPTSPHTFLNYIFINKADYEGRLIEDELFAHELLHVRQKHTLDILFIEMLKTIFWFNPLLYLYKRAIQLNHEFLADEAVVEANDNVISYQRLLLQKAQPAEYNQLASSLNFYVTKKRFTMMTKATTRSKALVLKLALLPIITALIALFCIETIAQERPGSGQQAGKAASADTLEDDAKRDRYYTGVWIKINDEPRGIKIDKPYEDLTQEQKRAYLPLLKGLEKKTPTAEEFSNWKNNKKFALWLDGKNIDNKALDKISPKDIATFTGSSVFKNARTKQYPPPYQFSLYTHEYYETNLKRTFEKYQGKIYELHVYADKKIESNSAIAAKYELEKQEAEVKEANKAAGYEDKIYALDEVTIKPEYPGGMNAFYNFVTKNFRVPDIDGDVVLKIQVSFVIEKDGRMSNIKILKDPGHGMGPEAERVLKLMAEKWQPGKLKDKPVRVSYPAPITINIKN